MSFKSRAANLAAKFAAGARRAGRLPRGLFTRLKNLARARAGSGLSAGQFRVSPSFCLKVLFVLQERGRSRSSLAACLRWLERHSALDVHVLLMGGGALAGKEDPCCRLMVRPADAQPSPEELAAFCRNPDLICADALAARSWRGDLAGQGSAFVIYEDISVKSAFFSPPPEIAAAHFLRALREASGKPPPVSVIVPNYNYARYLPERMASIFNQTFRDYEVIILDDASTDGSMAVIERLRSYAAVRIISNTVNSGRVCEQWKKGLESARGEFIWIAEADDLCSPDFLESMLVPLLDPDVALAYGIPSVIDADGGRVDLEYRAGYLSFAAGAERWSGGYVSGGAEEVVEALGIVNCIPNASAVVFRRPKSAEAIDAARSYICSGDWAFYLHLAKTGKVAYVHGDLARHRRHEKSVIAKDMERSGDKILAEMLEIHAWVRANFKVSPETENKMRAIVRALQKPA